MRQCTIVVVVIDLGAEYEGSPGRLTLSFAMTLTSMEAADVAKTTSLEETIKTLEQREWAGCCSRVARGGV